MKKLAMLFLMAAALLSAQRSVVVMTADTQSNPKFSEAFRSGGAPPTETLADFVSAALTGQGAFTLVDREHLNKVLKELNLSFSDLFDETKALRVGKLIQADSFVFVNVVDFNMEKSVFRIGGKLGLPSISRVKVNTTISVSAKLIDVQTGRSVVATADGTQKTSGGITVGPAGTDVVQVVGGIAKKAMQQAAEAVAKGLADRARNLPLTRQTVISDNTSNPAPNQTLNLVPKQAVVPGPQVPVVAKVEGATVVLAGGKQAGMKVGDRMAVKRPGNVIMHPLTQKEIGRELTDIEVVTVTEVQEQMATAKASTTSKARIADIVVPAPAEVAKTPEPAPASQPKPRAVPARVTQGQPPVQSTPTRPSVVLRTGTQPATR